jgi:histidyl-tRNA synthetase
MKKIIQSLKGARDFYPEDMGIRSWLYATLREVSESFGYQEYDGPFLESLELYAAKSGEELVKEQSYVFPDRGGDLITLRPELTPSLTRMIAQRQKQLVYPLRWWSWGPFWRYERPQKGRSREFFQWNVDLLGTNSPESDAEMVGVIGTFFKRVGLTPDDVVINVNNRKLVDAELSEIGVPREERPEVSRMIDRRNKMSAEDWDAYVLDSGLSQEQLHQLKDRLADLDLWRKSEDMVRFFEAADQIGVRPYLQFDPNTVRGLDYYTGTVFEAIDNTGDFRRSILGGGRYDDLLAAVGGYPLPGVGFAMGDVIITGILEKMGKLPENPGSSPAQILVTVFDEGLLKETFSLARDLRQAGLKTATYPEVVKLPKQFKYADRMGIRLAAVLGPDELAGGKVTLKDLRSGEQESVLREDMVGRVKLLLEKQSPS